MILRGAVAFSLPVFSAAIYDGSLDFRNLDAVYDHRHSFCDVQAALQNGSLELSKALEGLHLDFVTALYDPAWFDEPVNNNDPALMTGFHVDLVRLLASHGGFSYTIHSVPLSSFAPEMSWTEYLDASTQKFDLNLDYWLATDDRATLGLQPPVAFLDMSLVPAVYGEVAEATVQDKFWAFTRPLSKELWVLFLGISVVSSLVFFVFEKDVSNDIWDRHDKTRMKLLNSMFLGFSSYTGSQPFAPASNTGKILSCTHSFFILLLVSAYTANLAAHLVVEQNVSVCDSFDSCVGEGKSVCVLRGTELDEWLTGAYGHLENDNRIQRADASPWPGLASGQCDIVLDSVIGYEIAKVNQDYNSDCTLSRVGESTLQHYGGGWMSRTDYYRCTSVLRDAMAVHMLKLSSSGEIQALVDAFVAAQQSQADCTDTSGEISTEADGLPWDTMLGPVVIHAAGIILAFLFYFHRHFKKRRRSSLNLISDDAHLTAIAHNVCEIREQLDKLAADLGRPPNSARSGPMVEI